MSRWFRHYAGMMRDEKLVSAAMRSKQSIERVVWIWGAILESAAEVNDNGKFSLDTAEAAYFLRADEADLVGIMGALEQLGRLSEGRVAKWGQRQFSSDKSAERTRNYRERAKGDGKDNVTKEVGDGDVTSQQRHGDAPELETDTEIEKKDIRAVAPATRPRLSLEFEEFWKAYPRREGANPKAPAEKLFTSAVRGGADPQAIIAGARRCAAADRDKIGTPYIPQAMKWLRDKRWEDYQPPPTAGPVVAPEGALSDEQLRAKYARPTHPIPPENQADSPAGTRTDQPAELQRSGAEILPGLRSFGGSHH